MNWSCGHRPQAEHGSNVKKGSTKVGPFLFVRLSSYMVDNAEIKDQHLCRSVGYKGGLRKVGVNPSLGPRPLHPCSGRFTPLPFVSAFM